MNNKEIKAPPTYLVRIDGQVYQLCKKLSKENGLSIANIINSALLQGLSHKDCLVKEEAKEIIKKIKY